MMPSEYAARRGVREILHFTTDKGVMGSLRKQALLSREQLQDDPDLAFILLEVWPVKAPQWVDFISLSVQRINLDLWQRAVRNLPDRWWAVMAFTPAILDDDGVWFSTTNNIYPAAVRGQGTASLASLFADEVAGRYGYPHTRDGKDDSQPTDRAAEVLYPTSLGLEHLTGIYVGTADHRRIVCAWCSAFGLDVPPVTISTEIFA
jgi:hypothetical protein